MSQAIRGHQTLWKSVMVVAITDAIKSINSRSLISGFERAVAIEMIYFHSADWRLLCEMADVSYCPRTIERFLRSDMAAPTQAAIYRNFGLRGDRPEGEVA